MSTYHHITPYQHTLAHLINTPYQHTLTHPINTPYQHTLTYPNTPYQHTFSTHPINTPYHHTLAYPNTPYQHTISTHSPTQPMYTPSNTFYPLPPTSTPLGGQDATLQHSCTQTIAEMVARFAYLGSRERGAKGSCKRAGARPRAWTGGGGHVCLCWSSGGCAGCVSA